MLDPGMDSSAKSECETVPLSMSMPGETGIYAAEADSIIPPSPSPSSSTFLYLCGLNSCRQQADPPLPHPPFSRLVSTTS